MNESLRQSEKFVEATIKRTPVRRWAQPAEFGEIAAFLADPSLDSTPETRSSSTAATACSRREK